MYMKNKRKLTPWLYSMPALILIGMVIVFPIIYTGYISLTNMNLFHWSNYEFIGLSNYSRALLKADSGFLGALFTTLLWTALNMVIQVVVAYFIALGFQREDLKGKRVYKTLLMFPWAMPAYVSILLWRVGIYNTEFGLLNKILVAHWWKGKFPFHQCAGISLLHDSKPVDGIAVYDYDDRRCTVQH